ncbi:MAG: ACT domain-containing protein [Methanobacteriota archaeon]|nr:MAG: ACT domain-containing protein [Euryarchaeota archaeon]
MTEPWKVAKFGGNCVSTVDMYERIAHLVETDPNRKFLVVSAISGVTDSLVTILAQPREEKEIDPYVEELRRKHLGLLPKSREGLAGSDGAIDALVTKLERLLYGVAYTEEITPRTRDFVLSFGERLAAQVVAANLCQAGIDAAPHEADAIGLITDDTYGNATALLDETRARLAPFLRREALAGHVSVITGFFGLSREGKTATFGRGGSDYSAAVVAHALELPTIEIWKDVGGFMSADPKIVSEAFPLSALSYDEAPDETGTRIGPDTVDRSGDVKSISYVRDLATLKVFATGAGQKEGLLSQVATALTSAGTNVYSAATSQTCIALLVDADALSRAKKAVARLPFGLVERIEVLPHVSLISFVGEGLGYAHGVAARVFRAVAERGINVQLISAGASMVAYTFTVDNEDLERAVQAVHREFFGHRYLRPEVPAGSQRQG